MIALMLALTGCTWLSPEDYADRADHDGDGVPLAKDCDDDDAGTYPGAPELCDTVDQDCDGDAAEPAITGWIGEVPSDLTDATTITLTDYDRVEVCGGIWESALQTAPSGSAHLAAHSEYAAPTWKVTDSAWLTVPEGAVVTIDPIELDTTARVAPTAPLIDVQGGTLHLGSVIVSDPGSAPVLTATDALVTVDKLEITDGIFDQASVVLTRSELDVRMGSWTNNRGEDAGAVHLQDASTLVCSDCTARTNTSLTPGGALLVQQSSCATWSGVADDNHSIGGGGFMWLEDSSEAELTDCVLSANRTEGGGGAIGGSLETTSSIEVRRCEVTGNQANGELGLAGGVGGHALIIEDSTFTDNYAQIGGGDAFALVAIIEGTHFTGSSSDGMAGSLWTFGSAFVSDVSFSGATAMVGGCMTANGETWLDQVSFTGCTANFIEDPAPLGGVGGALAIDQFAGDAEGVGPFIAEGPTPRVSFDDVQFDGNTAQLAGGAIWSRNAELYQVADAAPLTFVDNSTNFEGGAIWAIHEQPYDIGGPDARIRFDASVVFEENTAPTGSAIFLQDFARMQNASNPECAIEELGVEPQTIGTRLFIFPVSVWDGLCWNWCDGGTCQ